MSELAFTLATIVALFVVAIPATTLAAKLLLVAKRWRAPEITAYGSSWGHLYVTAPVIIPTLWVVSAALHQSEPGGALHTCLADHLLGTVCMGALTLAAALALGGAVTAASIPGVRGAPPPSDAPQARRQQARIFRVAATHPELRRWASRIVVIEGGGNAACARGLLRPRIEVSLEYVQQIDDDMLRGVLLHEIEHVVCGDPLRGLLGELALRLNPLGGLLRSEFARWRLAREVACDRHAVRHGADRAALAQALVSGARYGQPCAAVPGVQSVEREALELRVHLLLDSNRRCECGSRRGALVAAALLGAVAIAPHVVGSEPLDSFHQTVDHAAHRALDH